jgi:hypothetical protein
MYFSEISSLSGFFRVPIDQAISLGTKDDLEDKSQGP